LPAPPAAEDGAPSRPKPPGQPSTGYGGAGYRHATIRSSPYGTGGRQYWIFAPADPSPEKAPVVVFLHGWGGMDPLVYGAWIEHLARHGNLVVFPRYQADLLTPPPEMTPNAAWAVKDALERLAEGTVKPDLTRFALVGHSLGGVIAANLAARGGKDGLPAARAVLAVEPGDSRGVRAGIRVPTAFEPLGRIPAETLLLAVVGEDDHLVGSYAARRILREAASVPPANKNLVYLRSDDHGAPALRADHFMPLGGRGGQGVDALDWLGLWRLFDALRAAAFDGADRRHALGGTPEQRHMGAWSDGTPVKELDVEGAPLR
jgi:pimeloyl-ACP methyl ester carboxylesterase